MYNLHITFLQRFLAIAVLCQNRAILDHTWNGDWMQCGWGAFWNENAVFKSSWIVVLGWNLKHIWQSWSVVQLNCLSSPVSIRRCFHLHILQLNDADWSRVLPGAAEIQHLLILFMQVVHTVRHDKAHHSIVYSAHNSCWNRSLNHFVRQAKLWYKSCWLSLT